MIKRYFENSQPTFWLLRDDAIEWSTVGGTLAMKEEVLSIIEHLDGEGVPDFNTILFVLGAMDEKSSKLIPQFIEHCIVKKSLGIHDNWRKLWQAFSGKLQKLNQDPPAIGHPYWKAYVIGKIGEVVIPEETFSKHVAEFGHVWPIEEQELFKSSNSYLRLLTKMLSDCLLYDGPLEKKSIEMAYQTGLQEPPELVEITVPDSTGSSLLEQLEVDDSIELRALAEVAKAIYPSFAIKGKKYQPQDIPLGGYADIANKGSLERLVTSELAHDSLTLAVRIVTGEAMYLKREAPPEKHSPVRHICIDRGIRTWGKRRVLVTAGAMAIARAGENQVEANCVQTAELNDLEGCDLESLEGIVEHMSDVSRASQPGGTLERFSLLREGPEDECYLVTSKHCLNDPHFLQAVHQHTLVNELFVLAIEESGLVELYLYSKYGQRQLFSVTVDFDQVLAKCMKVGDGKERSPKTNSQLNYYDHYPLPLALPGVIQPKRFIPVIHGGFVGRDKWKQLVYHQIGKKAPYILLGAAPTGTYLYAYYHKEKKAIYLLSHQNNDYQLSVVYLNGRAFEIHSIELPKRASYYFDFLYIYVLSSTFVYIYDLEGNKLATKKITSIDRSGRYLNVGDEWFLVVYNAEIKLIAAAAHTKGATNVMNCEIDGKVHVLHSKDGKYYLDNQLVYTSKAVDLEFKHSSRGNILCVGGEMLSLEGMNINYPYGVFDRSGDLDVFDYKCNSGYVESTVVKNFQSVAIDGCGDIVLYTIRKAPFIIRKNSLSNYTFKHSESQTYEELDKCKFQPIELDSHPDCFSIAELPNGYNYILDTRGYLHCVFRDGTMPAITLMLTTGKLTGWCSKFGAFGLKEMINCDTVFNENYPDSLEHMWKEVAYD